MLLKRDQTRDFRGVCEVSGLSRRRWDTLSRSIVHFRVSNLRSCLSSVQVDGLTQTKPFTANFGGR